MSDRDELMEQMAEALAELGNKAASAHAFFCSRDSDYCDNRKMANVFVAINKAALDALAAYRTYKAQHQ